MRLHVKRMLAGAGVIAATALAATVPASAFCAPSTRHEISLRVKRD